MGDGRVLAIEGDDVAAEVFDARSNTFTPTGSMRVSRVLPTSTLLGDGRVLLAGGGAGAQAELYDPTRGVFSLTGSLVRNRNGHTATRLADGRVLIAGGVALPMDPDSPAFLASAEIYDPATGKFTSTGSMRIPRENAQAVRLGDGRVLIAGGDQGTCGACDRYVPLASAEIYDPATARFSLVGAMAVPRIWQAMTLLGDGRVLVTGGASTDGSPLALAETYDPLTGGFAPTGDMGTPRVQHTATLLPDGRVLIAGGWSSVDPGGTASAEVYNPAWGAFAPTGSMAILRMGHSATLLQDGRVLVVAGSDYGGQAFELYWP